MIAPMHRRSRCRENCRSPFAPLGLGLACLPLLALAGCAGTSVPRPFTEAAATAPEDVPARLRLDGSEVLAVAAASGPGGIPQPVRSAIEAVVPGGEPVFLGREWGSDGETWLVEKRYLDGTEESFRTARIAKDGAILERTHSWPIAKVPAPVIGAALSLGRDVRRCEIVSDANVESCWRAFVVDGGGRRLLATIGLDGTLLATHRIVGAELVVPHR